MEIRFEHVDFFYQKVNCSSKNLFKDLNVTFIPDKIYGLVGKCGSGKTTLLELINGTISPTGGNIWIDEMNLNSTRRINFSEKNQCKIGYMHQNCWEQFINKRVYDELSCNLILYNHRFTDIYQRIINALQMVDLDNSYLNRNLTSLSTGERKRVALASILIYNPKILLLDEPFVGLDQRGKDIIVKILRVLKNRYHKTIIIATQDTDSLHRIVDTVCVIGNKKIILQGGKYDVFKETKILKKYGVQIPKVMDFSLTVLQKKNIKMGYRDDVNDLLKDIYRFVK